MWLDTERGCQYRARKRQISSQLAVQGISTSFPPMTLPIRKGNPFSEIRYGSLKAPQVQKTARSHLIEEQNQLMCRICGKAFYSSMLSTNHRAGVGSVEGLPNLSSGSCPPLLTGMLMGKAHVLSESQSYGPLEHWEDERTPLADEALAAPADCDWTRDEGAVTLDGFDVDALKVEVGAELL